MGGKDERKTGQEGKWKGEMGRKGGGGEEERGVKREREVERTDEEVGKRRRGGKGKIHTSVMVC